VCERIIFLYNTIKTLVDKGLESSAMEVMYQKNIPKYPADYFLRYIRNGDHHFNKYNEHCHNIKHILDTKGKIHAIKEFRSLTGNGLKYSKEYVDAVEYGFVKQPDWIPKELWEI